MTRWQWHELDHMQIICTWLHTDNQTSTSPTHVLQHKINKKLQPGLVASYNIWPGIGEGLFWYWRIRRFINLSLT